MMIDEDIVTLSPSSVCRVLSGAGLLGRWNRTGSHCQMLWTGFVSTHPLEASFHAASVATPSSNLTPCSCFTMS